MLNRAFDAYTDHNSFGLQVEQILDADLFSRPAAVLSIAVAGSNIGTIYCTLRHSAVQPLDSTARADLSGSQSAAQVEVEAPDTAASELLTAIASSRLTASGLVKQLSLDYTSLQGCGNACLEESLKVLFALELCHLHKCTSAWLHSSSISSLPRAQPNSTCLLQQALAAVDAVYTPGAGPLKGTVSFQGVDLPITSTAGQLWATELAALYQTAQDAAQERTRRYGQHTVSCML